MAYVISKTLTVTRVKYQTVVVEDGAPKFVEHPDAVFRGILTQERAQRMLQSRLGKDIILVITNMDAGQKRFEMDMEQFVLHAQVAEAEHDGEEVPDEDEAGEPAEPAEEEPVEEPSEPVEEETSELEEKEPSENPPSEEPASGESEKEPEEQLSEEDKRRFAPPSWWEES